MVSVKVIMNSAVETIFASKCCNTNVIDQNLEIIISNDGSRPVIMTNHFTLENEHETVSYPNLYPPWNQTIAPGDKAAFYCSMDSSVLEQYRTITIFDNEENSYSFPIQG